MAMAKKKIEQSVLIVDDEIHVCNYMANIVRGIGFTNIKIMTNPLDVVQWCENFSPSLVLLDINMPHYTGIDILEAMHRKMIECCVIMMTTINAKEHIQLCLEYGVKNYILKDQEPGDIVNIIQATLCKCEFQKNTFNAKN